jgi:hypothetical protein
MRKAQAGVVLFAAVACGPPPAPAQGPAPSKSAARSDSALSPAKMSVPAPVALQRQLTGQAQPSLVVENELPIPQYVFIDWVQRAKLGPSVSQRFELEPGTHTVTCADSPDPDHHPAAVTETFETGYAYVYTLRTGR